jgi:hypothetical protein
MIARPGGEIDAAPPVEIRSADRGSRGRMARAWGVWLFDYRSQFEMPTSRVSRVSELNAGRFREHPVVLLWSADDPKPGSPLRDAP